MQKHVTVPAQNLPVERFWRIVAKRAILATGAEERPLVFGGNDTPGVMMAGAMRTYLNRFGVAPGSSVAIFTTNDSRLCACPRPRSGRHRGRRHHRQPRRMRTFA